MKASVNPSHKTVRLSGLLLLVATLAGATGIAACGMSAPNIAAPDPSTPTQTITPPLTLTAAPTITPTPILPVLEGTPVPQTFDKISVENAARLTQLARWGRGAFIDAIYSPDGKNIAVVTTIGIYVLDSETLEEQYFFTTAYKVSHAKYLPDGERIAIAYRDAVEIVRARDGSSLAKFNHPDANKADAQPATVRGMALSANGEFIAVAYSDSTFDLWRVSNGELVSDLDTLEKKVRKELKATERLPIFQDALIGLALSPDGKVLYAGLSALKIIAFDVTENRVLREFRSKYQMGVFREIALSADGSVLAAYGHIRDSSFLTIWYSENGLLVRDIRIDSWLVFALSPDGKKVVTLSFLMNSNINDNYRLEAWNLGSDDPPKLLGKYDLKSFQWSKKLVISPDRNRVLMYDEGSYGNSFRLLGIDSGELVKDAEADFPRLYYASLSPSGEKVAIVDDLTGSKGIRIINIKDGSSFYTLENIKSIQRARYTPDGEYLFIASWDTLYLFPSYIVTPPYNLTNGESDVWIDLSGYYERPLDIAVSRNFGFIALRTGVFVDSEEVLAYSVRNQEYFRMENLPFTDPFTNDWTTLEFSPDERYLAVGAGKLQVIRTKDWEKIGEIAATHGTFSPDSAYIAYGQADRSIQVSTIPSLEPVFTTAQLPYTTMSLVYSPDGTILVTGSLDGVLRLWDSTNGALLKEIEAHNDMIASMEFLPDGKSLLTFGYDATVRLWGIMP